MAHPAEALGQAGQGQLDVVAGVEGEVDRLFPLGELRRAAGHAELGAEHVQVAVGPVGAGHLLPVRAPPEQVRHPVHLARARVQEALLAQDRVGLSEADDPAGELEELGIGGVPVDPAGVVVLRIGVVVALLAVAQLVAGKDHRRALAEQQRRQHVAAALRAGVKDHRLVAGALDAEIVRCLTYGILMVTI